MKCNKFDLKKGYLGMRKEKKNVGRRKRNCLTKKKKKRRKEV